MTPETGVDSGLEAAGLTGTGRWAWLRSRWPRLIVSAALLIFVLSRIDREQLGPTLSGINLGLLALAQLANFAMLGLNALRWQVMLRAQGTALAYPQVIYYYLIGAFFNTFMPTSIGGDLVRVLMSSKHTGRKSVTLASVVVERLLGFFVLVPVSLVGIALTFRDFESPRLLLVLELTALAIFVTAGVLLNQRVARGILGLFHPLFSRIPRVDLETKLSSVYEALRLYGAKRREIALGVLISILSRVVWIFGCYLVAVGLGLGAVTVARLFTVIPLVELARMVPISLGGVGVREGTFAGLMSQFGVASTPAIVLSLLFYFLSIINGLTGGCVYLVRTLSKR